MLAHTVGCEVYVVFVDEQDLTSRVPYKALEKQNSRFVVKWLSHLT